MVAAIVAAKPEGRGAAPAVRLRQGATDHHSRLFLAADASCSAKGGDVVRVFLTTIESQSAPADLLTEAGAVFTGGPRRGKIWPTTRRPTIPSASLSRGLHAVAYRECVTEHRDECRLNGGRELTGSTETGPMAVVRQFVAGGHGNDRAPGLDAAPRLPESDDIARSGIGYSHHHALSRDRGPFGGAE